MENKQSSLHMAEMLFGIKPTTIDLKNGNLKIRIPSQAIQKINSLDPEKRIELMKKLSKAIGDANKIIVKT